MLRRTSIDIFVESAPIAVAMVDREMRYIQFSPSWMAELGHAPKDIGRGLYEMNPEVREPYGDLHRRALAGEHLQTDYVMLPGPNGGIRWTIWDITPWRRDDGEIGGLLLFSRDVTAQKLAEEAVVRTKAFLATVIEHVPSALVVKHGVSGQFLIGNLASERLLGISRTEHLGKSAHDLFPKAVADAIVADDRKVLASGELKITEGLVLTPVGPRFLQTQKVRIPHPDGSDCLLAILDDVTERHDANEAVKDALERAEAANIAKSEFLANMSHEIRTPLNGVLGLAEALSRMDLGEKQREIVGAIRSSGKALTTLLSDVLDLAKAESGALELHEEPFDLRKTIAAAAYLFETVARDKGLGFHIDIDHAVPQRLVGDTLRIKQVLGNLISNAVKFTSHGAIEIQVAATLREDGAFDLRVKVQDTGPGFSEETRSKLFSRFEQGDGSITRRYGGTGLGLSIASRLARMMGGDIDCDAVQGEGAAFIFTARLAAAEAVASPETAPEAAELTEMGRPLRVLLAEDHPVNQKVVQLLLGDEVDLLIVADGQAAVEAFRREAFDVVLMDTQMPVMDGLTAIRAIRADERDCGRRRIPIVSLTANAMPHQVEACFEAGADLYLGKPVTAEGLFSTLNDAVEGQSKARDRSAA